MSEYQEEVAGPVRFYRIAGSVEGRTADDLERMINDLNGLSERLGCVVFDGDADVDACLVVFAGNLERFSMLVVAQKVRCKVVYFQDVISWWYNGSAILPSLDGIAQFLRKEAGSRRLLVFGQSSGGYAALVTGADLTAADVLAVSPQTFSDIELKGAIRFSQRLNPQSTPPDLEDVADLYRQAVRTGFAAVLIAASERGNPYQKHFWLDHFHAAHIIGVPHITLFIGDTAKHSIAFRRTRTIAEALCRLLLANREDVTGKTALVQGLTDALSETDQVKL